MTQGLQGGMLLGLLVVLCLLGCGAARAWWRVAFPDPLARVLGRTESVLEAAGLSGAAVATFGALWWVAS